MPGDFKPRGASRGGRGYGGRGRGRGGFSKANNYTNKKRSSPDAADDEEKAPQAKRAKATTGGDETDIIVPTVKQDEHANDYIAIKSNDLRRITVSDFKGSILVSIREYYESEKGLLPGKKGISLPLDQYNAFVSSLPLIEASLAKLGHKTVRPEYSGEPPVVASKEVEEESAEEAEKVAKEDVKSADNPEEKKRDDEWDLDVAGYDE